MNIHHLRELYDYHYATNAKVWGCVAELSEEQYRNGLSYSVGTIHQHIRHMALAEYFWFSSLKRGEQTSPDEMPGPHDYTTLADVMTLYEEVEFMVQDFLSQITDSDLGRILVYKFSRHAQSIKSQYWQVIMQMYSHGIDHRAQILSMLHQMKAPTTEQDFIIHMWEQTGTYRR